MKAAFFDRDGTLIKDVHYLSSLQHIELIEQAIYFARQCQERGFTLFVVTNQSGIARGLFTEQFVIQTHEVLKNYLQEYGVNIKEFYYCPHHPTHSVISDLKKSCLCRKPEPGMLTEAASRYGINLQESLMFGDKDVDIQAGNAAGCRSFLINQVLNMSIELRNKEIFNVQEYSGVRK